MLQNRRIRLLLILSLMMAVVFLFSACGNGNGAPAPAAPAGSSAEASSEESQEAEQELLELTLEELAEFDGQDGRPAYVAVDGVIYDVSDSRRWRGGSHNGFEAGQDLTEEIANVSPHGVRVLERMPEVGRIVE